MLALLFNCLNWYKREQQSLRFILLSLLDRSALWHRTHEVYLTSELEASLGTLWWLSEPIACKAEAVWRPACTSGAAAHKFTHRRDEKTSRDAFQLYAKSHFPPLTIFTRCLSHTHRALEHLTALWLVWQAGDILLQPSVLIFCIYPCRSEAGSIAKTVLTSYCQGLTKCEFKK